MVSRNTKEFTGYTRSYLTKNILENYSEISKKKKLSGSFQEMPLKHEKPTKTLNDGLTNYNSIRTEITLSPVSRQ